MDKLVKKAIQSKIKKNYKNFTDTEKCIAKIILDEPNILLSNTLDLIARKSNSSQASIYRFIQKIGFRNVFALKLWLNEKKIEDIKNFPLVVDVVKTLEKLSNVEIKLIIESILTAKKIFVTAKSSSVHIARSLEKKLVKLHFNATFVSEINEDAYQKYPNATWIFVSISGALFMQKTQDIANISKNGQLILFSATPPSLEIASYFNYVVYGYTKQEFLLKEINFPLDSEILCLLVINEFVKKIAKQLNE